MWVCTYEALIKRFILWIFFDLWFLRIGSHPSTLTTNSREKNKWNIYIYIINKSEKTKDKLKNERSDDRWRRSVGLGHRGPWLEMTKKEKKIVRPDEVYGRETRGAAMPRERAGGCEWFGKKGTTPRRHTPTRSKRTSCTQPNAWEAASCLLSLLIYLILNLILILIFLFFSSSRHPRIESRSRPKKRRRRIVRRNVKMSELRASSLYPPRLFWFPLNHLVVFFFFTWREREARQSVVVQRRWRRWGKKGGERHGYG